MDLFGRRALRIRIEKLEVITGDIIEALKAERERVQLQRAQIADLQAFNDLVLRHFGLKIEDPPPARRKLVKL